MEVVVAFAYGLSLVMLFLFSMGQLNLAFHYRKKRSLTAQTSLPQQWPVVTVQLPVYNEQYVVQRLIESVINLEYDRSLLEIQVLDDSTDETSDIIARLVAQYQSSGYNIQHIQRPNREGFKAGALGYGTTVAKGEFIAIFDADFLPKEQFLRETIPHFGSPDVGMVQTRWGHVNETYSLLTKMQAFGLDAHFTVEQAGRNKAGSFISFNGTAGVWRKSCITDAGGWSSETLTEDLDLSYRAQLKGWKFKFLEDIVSPAELPVLLSAVKSQQFRWNKGAAETARKNLGQIVRSRLSPLQKIHATFHLMNSSVFILLLLTGILSIPMLFIKNSNPDLKIYFDIGSIFLLGFFAIAYFYWVACKRIKPEMTLKYYLVHFPLFLAFSMGLSLHNAIAVVEGLFGKKSPFIRTPKFNINSKKDSWRGNHYINLKVSASVMIESLLCLYFLAGIAAGIYLADFGLILFHLMLALGFGAVTYLAFKPLSYARA